LSIENRDWERALGFVLSLGMWLSPVIYAPTMIPARLRDLYHLNPMVGILLGFRAALFNGFPIPVWELAYSAIWALVILIFGIWAFRRTEVQLADRL
jgi:lipopolysaccharide transport system permease protein